MTAADLAHQVSADGEEAARRMHLLSLSLTRLSESLRDMRTALSSRSVPAVPVLVPTEDGGNRDMDTWGHRPVVPRDRDTDEDTWSEGAGTPVPSQDIRRTGGQFFDGTRWRTVRPRLYIAQGHP